jgi:hypothetical protein
MKRRGPKPVYADEWARGQLGLPPRYPGNTEWTCSIVGCRERAVASGPCKDWYCHKHVAIGKKLLAGEDTAE